MTPRKFVLYFMGLLVLGFCILSRGVVLALLVFAWSIAAVMKMIIENEWPWEWEQWWNPLP